MQPQPSSATRNSDQTRLLLPRGRLYDPFEHAHFLGIAVAIQSMDDAYERWFPERRLIVLDPSLRPTMRREALAHGIGHAELGHVSDSERNENQANRYASLYLIDPLEIRSLMKWVDNADQLADELGVTRVLLDAYLSWAA